MGKRSISRLLVADVSSPATRNQMADTAKAVAAILVVTGHLIYCDAAKLPTPYYFSEILNIVHMPLFCLAGGYFSVQMLEKSFYSMLKKTALRILLPYILWSTVAVAAKAGMSLLHGSFSLWENLTLLGETLLYGKSLWFFLTLFWIRIFAWGMIRLKSVGKWVPLTVLVGIAMIPLPNTTELYVLVRLQDLLPIFYIGYYLHSNAKLNAFLKKSLRARAAWLICCTILLTSPLLADLYRLIPKNILETPLKIMVKLILLPGVFLPICVLLHKCLVIEQRIAGRGLYTLDIYCIHMVFVEYLRFQMPERIVFSAQWLSSLCYLLESVVITAFCVLIAKLLHGFVPPYRWMMSGSWPQKPSETKGIGSYETELEK